MSSPPPVLVFDVMDTLVVDPFHHELPAFFGLTFEQFLAEKHPTAWIQFETARLGEADYARQLFRDRRPVDLPGLRAHLAAAYRWVDGMHELLADLSAAGHELHALSNYGVWYHLIDDELGLSRYLDWSFVSWDTGLRKPDPRAYAQVERRLQRPTNELLFVDDRQANVAAARARGWGGIRFTDAGRLREQLHRRGVATDTDDP